jgi:outer membrane receptor for ferrienterochelin and colicins
VNLQHEFNIAKNNTLKSGISYKHLQLAETIQFTDNFIARNYDGVYTNREHIIGFFWKTYYPFLTTNSPG